MQSQYLAELKEVKEVSKALQLKYVQNPLSSHV
jgi:hypothetical protein